MSEAIWAQIISGFFGLMSIALGTYLPQRLRRRKNDGNDVSRNTGAGEVEPNSPTPEVNR